MRVCAGGLVVLDAHLSGLQAMLRKGELRNRFPLAPAIHVGASTDEIQKKICAERLLGLPLQPSTDEYIPLKALPKG